MKVAFEFDTVAAMRAFFAEVFTDPGILSRLDVITYNQEQIMATEQNLQDTLDIIKNSVTTVVNKLDSQAKQITDLKAQLAAGSPVSQAQLDALEAEAQSIADQLRPVTDIQPPSAGALGSQPLADR